MNEPRLTAAPADEQELIALIENKPPDELTIGEIEALRAALPHSPELQRVLSRHIQMDQYLADALGRLSVSVDEILARAAAATPHHRRGLPLSWAFGLLFLLAGIGGFLLVSGFAMWNRPATIAKRAPSPVALKPAEEATAATPAAKGKAKLANPKISVATVASKKPPANQTSKSQPDVGASKITGSAEPFVAVATLKPETLVAEKPATPSEIKADAETVPPQAAEPINTTAPVVTSTMPAGESTPPVAEPVVRPAGPWDAADQLGGPLLKVADAAFAGEPVVADAAHLESLRNWFEAVPGANYQFNVDATQATLQGVARVKAPWDEHAVLRMELGNLIGTRIHLWHGETGVSIYAKQPAPDVTWAAAVTTRKAMAATPATYALTSTDKGRAWRTGDNGPAGPSRIDIRYEQGQVIVSRGDIVLVSAPLPGVPQEVYLEGRTLLKDLRMVRSEPLPAETAIERTTELSFVQPATAKWQTELTPSARFIATETGSVSLTSSGASTVQRAGIAIPPRGLREFVFEVSNFTAGAGIYVGDENGVPMAQARFVLDKNSKTGQLALVYPALTDQTFETPLDFNAAVHGYAANRAFIRLLASGGRLRYWISADGQHWAQLGQPQRLPTHDIRSVGILCGPFQQPCGITLDKLEVRSFAALDEIAPLETLEQVPTIVVDQLPLWLERVLESQPAEFKVEANQWRAACAARTLAAGPPQPLAGKLAQLLMQDALAQAKNVDAQWSVLRTMAFVADTWTKGEGALDWTQFEAEAEKLGQQQLAAGNPQPFQATLAHLIRLPVWTTDSPKLPLAELARDELLALVAMQQWSDIRRTSQILTSYGYLGHRQENLQLAATNTWANASAVEHGGQEPVDEDSSVLDVRWRHPLSIELSKEGFNVLAELEVALANRAYKDACQIVATTRGAGAFGVLPSGKDARLWSSFPLAVSETMRRFPKMQETMREHYGAVGLLRVKQSMVEADDQSLEMATVQFYGTPAAALAHFWLGDRYLAAGDFIRAIRHYTHAEPDAEVALRSQILSHRRLASALAGVDWGTPATQAVQMGEALMPAERFEALVAEVLQRGRSSATAVVAAADINAADPNAAAVKRFRYPVDLPPAPAPTSFKATVRGKLESMAGSPPGAAQQSAQAAGVDWVAQNFAGVVEKEFLYYTDGAQAMAWNLATNAQAWRTAIAGPGGSSQLPSLSPLRPVLVEGMLVLRRRIQQGFGIVALRADTGAVVWQAEGQRDDSLRYPAISDPVAWSDEFLTLVTEPLGKHSLISLAAYDGATGQLRRKLPVGLFSQSWLQYQTCSIALHGDSLLAMLGGSVLCLDPEGEIRWIRRQAWISPDIALDWAARDVRPPTIHAEQIYLAGPGTQGLECLDVTSGKLLWKQPACNVHRVLGVEQGVVIVETTAGLSGLDAGSGEFRWHHADTQRLDAAWINGPGELAYARKVAAREPNQFHPQIVWLAAESGQLISRSTIWELSDSNPGFGPVFQNEAKTWALFGRGVQQLTRDLVELTPEVAPAEALLPPAESATSLLNRWTIDVSPRMVEAVETVLPAWTLINGDSGPLAGLLPEIQGRKNVLSLKTANNQPTRLTRLVTIPEAGKTTLTIDFAAQPAGACILLARVSDTTLWRKKVSGVETSGSWQQTQIDLTPFAGLTVWLQLQQIPTGQANEEAFLHRAEVTTSP